MPKFIDRTGLRYGRLVVVKRVGTDQLKKPLWECLCDCGKTALVNSTSLQTGNTTSCGCYLKERITKHGGTGKSSYNTWRAMMRRCYNQEAKDYPRYGGAGVRVDPEWHHYENFVAAMGEPNGNETLDRINPYGSYELSNCRWASPTVQARNIKVPRKSLSGVIGVTPIYGGKWLASITAKKKRYYSKVFDTIEEAAAARKELERLHWGEA